MKLTTVLSMGVVLALATACASTKEGSVAHATDLGPYIDATLDLPSGQWRFLFPQTEACRTLIVTGAPVDYARRSHFGRVSGPDDMRCEPVGIGTLSRWRRTRQPGEMAPSSQANWRIIHEDPQYLLLRGRFAEASRLGLTNTFDAVAVVANDAVCEPIARAGTANLFFRQAGKRVLDLGRCPLVAVAMPPPAS